jgi:hypothetical protein
MSANQLDERYEVLDARGKEYTALVVLVNINDHDKIILGSAMRSQKRQGRHLKDFGRNMLVIVN